MFKNILSSVQTFKLLMAHFLKNLLFHRYNTPNNYDNKWSIIDSKDLIKIVIIGRITRLTKLVFNLIETSIFIQAYLRL